MTLKFNKVLAVVEVHVNTKISSSEVQRFMSYCACSQRLATMLKTMLPSPLRTVALVCCSNATRRVFT